MWNKNSLSISSGDDSLNILAGGDVYLSVGNQPTELIDQKIEGQEVLIMREEDILGVIAA